VDILEGSPPTRVKTKPDKKVKNKKGKVIPVRGQGDP
jgi:hypothetical protein